jgi:hypothetical protein
MAGFANGVSIFGDQMAAHCLHSSGVKNPEKDVWDETVGHTVANTCRTPVKDFLMASTSPPLSPTSKSHRNFNDMIDSQRPEIDSRESSFPDTRWTCVRKSQNAQDPEEARQAFERLCDDYWNPVYAYARASNYRQNMRNVLSMSCSTGRLTSCFPPTIQRKNFLTSTATNGPSENDVRLPRVRTCLCWSGLIA